jgi:hypothetical protein
MRFHRHTLFVLFFLLCLRLPCAGAAGRPGIPWKGYQEALGEARQRSLPVFLFFYSYPCSSCSKMQSHTLMDSTVAAYLREHFVSVRIASPQNPLLSRRYSVRGLPTSVFLTPEGEQIAYLPGYVEPDVFLNVLKYIREGHYRSKTLYEYLKGP